MAIKGVAVNLKSYEETIPKLLKIVKFDEELKKHNKIALKPNLIRADKETSSKPEFVEQVLKFCMENKNPGTEVFIAEGCDGSDTLETFDELGYRELSEKYGIGLIDLNRAETEEIESPEFLRFETIHYPKILLNSFVITLPLLRTDEETGISASLDSMVGAFPASHYKGFFSAGKNKLNKIPKKYQVHDIIKCKMPNFSIIDGGKKSTIIVGQPLEMDKQAAKLLGLNWNSVSHLKLVDESHSEGKPDGDIDQLIGESS